MPELKIKPIPRRKIYLFLLGILITGTLFFTVYPKIKKLIFLKQPPRIPQQFISDKELKLIKVDNNQIPPEIPEDIFTEKNIIILEGYVAKGRGKTTSSIKFLSKKNLEENFVIYRRYIMEHNWILVNIFETENCKKISAHNGLKQQLLIVVICENNYTNQSLVEISVEHPSFIIPVKK